MRYCSHALSQLNRHLVVLLQLFANIKSSNINLTLYSHSAVLFVLIYYNIQYNTAVISLRVQYMCENQCTIYIIYRRRHECCKRLSSVCGDSLVAIKSSDDNIIIIPNDYFDDSVNIFQSVLHHPFWFDFYSYQMIECNDKIVTMHNVIRKLQRYYILCQKSNYKV